jgi:DNA polymerase-3 subunit alpha
LLAFASRIQKEVASGQTDLFGNAIGQTVMKPRISLEKVVMDFTPRDVLQWERELLGLYLSQHPLTAYETYLSELAMPIDLLSVDMDGKLAIIGGTINDIREITTKNGQKMAFVKLEDLSGDMELVLFPAVYQQTAGIWERDRIILARGRINGKDRTSGGALPEPKILIDEAREITHEQVTAYQPTGKKQKLPGVKKGGIAPAPVNTGGNQKVYIRLENTADQPKLLALKQVIDKNNGQTDVVLVLGPNESKQVVKLPVGMAPTLQALSLLRELVGNEQVIVQ